MPNHKDIFRNKVDFAREEFATEQLYKPRGIPRGREIRSQRKQYGPGEFHGRKRRSTPWPVTNNHGE